MSIPDSDGGGDHDDGNTEHFGLAVFSFVFRIVRHTALEPASPQKFDVFSHVIKLLEFRSIACHIRHFTGSWFEVRIPDARDQKENPSSMLDARD